MSKNKPAKFALPASCPCGNAAAYEACCGRWHHGPQRLMAPDAATLMRSRYTAFVLDELDYLLETWHASTRPAALDVNAPGVKWLGLQLRRQEQQDAAHATVEFVARSRHNGQAARLHEVSRFVREDERWFYLDGDFVEKASTDKSKFVPSRFGGVHRMEHAAQASGEMNLTVLGRRGAWAMVTALE